MPEIIVIVHNIRSTHNVGAIFRTCEGFGIRKLILSGYTPYPRLAKDTRLPHIVEKLTNQIHKTALGAELLVPFQHQEALDLSLVRSEGYQIVGLEQDKKATLLHKYIVPPKLALLIGEEVEGIEQSLRNQCDDLIEIPMIGQKESFNVSVAMGIALYGLCYPPK
ncbi:MAG TPA: TrmH family RNA methyltransferase [Candidatus Saccharimonadales bacterium]|nr:TrmH family RNA methyltransferase [Candidatus Saccharimonadales bacterium]